MGSCDPEAWISSVGGRGSTASAAKRTASNAPPTTKRYRQIGISVRPDAVDQPELFLTVPNSRSGNPVACAYELHGCFCDPAEPVVASNGSMHAGVSACPGSLPVESTNQTKRVPAGERRPVTFALRTSRARSIDRKSIAVRKGRLREAKALIAASWRPHPTRPVPI